MIYGIKNIKIEEIEGKSVIEVGSYNVNGSLKDHILKMKPKEYVGVDVQSGSYVDIVCNAENIIDKFGKEKFDFVLTTEMMEHVENWQKVISNLKNICKPNGIILLTTRSKGFGKHNYPNDFWRYEIEDMKHIFSDCIIENLESDSRYPGVFIKIKKPDSFIEKDLGSYQLYKVI
jgi:SAM-dependent methyltransferase